MTADNRMTETLDDFFTGTICASSVFNAGKEFVAGNFHVTADNRMTETLDDFFTANNLRVICV